MPVFYPAMACNLIIRFDEALVSGAYLSPKSAEDLADTLTLPLGGSVNKAGILDGAKDRLTHIISVIPKAASLELPGYRQAGKFSLTFAWRDLPLDPRAIRALGVEVYVGTVPAANFQRGMMGETNGDRPASYLVESADNLMLAGVVDNHTVTFNDKGSELKLDGRDLRAIFIDGKIAPSTVKQLNVDQPVHLVVKDILAKAPQGAQIQVNVDASDWPGGIVPAPAAKELLSRINLGAKGQKPAMPVKGQSKDLSFWDIITNFCSLVGAVPFFRGHALWIRPARSLFDQAKAGTKNGPQTKTPFKNGQVRNIKTSRNEVQISFRRMIYGRNVAALNFERKLGGVKVPTVLCVSVDPSKAGEAKLIEAKWPDDEDGADAARVEAAQVTSVDASGKESATDVLRIPVPGITDKDRLRAIAKQIYEEVGRGEMGGSCSSKDLASLGGDNDDADIVRLMPGDACEFLVDATGVQGLPPVVSELNTTASESTAEAARKLAQRLGGNRQDLAEVLVGTARGTVQKLQNVFRVANVKYSWAVDSGLAVDFDFQNYIESRYDVTPTLSDVTNKLLNVVSNVERALAEHGIAQQKAPSRGASAKPSTDDTVIPPWLKGK